MSKVPLTLIIGDKNLSSWSMRPWLALQHSGLSFKEKKILLDRPSTKKEIAKYSPTGKVPLLLHGNQKIWDSLAICEYIAELAPEAQLWPQDRGQRAMARSYVAEMHSGFQGLRGQLTMNVQLRVSMDHLSIQTVADIQRIVELWEKALSKSKGPFLFGAFTIADAFFAPVVMRFQSYGVKLKSKRCQKYMKNILNDRYVREWVSGAKKEVPQYLRF